MNSPDYIQTVYSEGSEACLRNLVVLSTVFEHFSSTELLELSFVNKLWNYEARSLMRRRANVIASFKSDEPCQFLESFGSILSGMNIIPFSGMQFCMNFYNHGYGCAVGAPDPIIPDETLDQMSWTHFSVHIGGEWWLHKSCPGLLQAKRVLQNYGEVLEELTLDLSWHEEEFVQEIVQDRTLPRLKILKFGDEHDPADPDTDEEDEVNTDYMKALVSRVPNLQELHSGGPPSLLLSLLERSSAVLVCSAVVRAPFDEILQGAISALRLKKVEMEYSGPDFNFERFNRIAPMLLRASCSTTLLSLRVDAVLAVALMSYGICLENVDDFQLVINYEDWEPTEQRIFRLVKCLDFTRIFPNVNKVKVLPCMEFNVPQLHPNDTSTIVEQTQAVWEQPLQDRAVNIKEVDFIRWTLSVTTAQFYAEMFPSIQKLHADVHGREDIPFRSIWKNWVDLKQLVISQSNLEDVRNLDSVFCGIFPEEIAELREKDEDYLLHVNIVPVMPAITCLRNLRTFSLHYRFHYGVQVGQDPSLIFSKVTVLTAFARYPKLDLIFNFPVENLQRAI